MKYVQIFIALAVIMIACKQPVKLQEGVTVYGEDFKVENAMTFDQVMDKLKTEESLETVMKVKVEKVCKMKGCWMTAVDPNGGEEEFFVKFKDYGFFVPIDFVDDGPKEVMIKGNAYVETTSVDELRHYAEDEGKSKEEIEEINEAEVQYKFMASGVKRL